MIPRLSSLEFLVLSLLTKSGRPCYALELVEAGRVTVRDGARVEFSYPLRKGSVYVTLGRMMDKGLIERRRDPVNGKIRRPLYQATERGLKLLAIAQQFDKQK